MVAHISSSLCIISCTLLDQLTGQYVFYSAYHNIHCEKRSIVVVRSYKIRQKSLLSHREIYPFKGVFQKHQEH